MPFDNVVVTAGLELALDCFPGDARAKKEEVNVEAAAWDRWRLRPPRPPARLRQKKLCRSDSMDGISRNSSRSRPASAIRRAGRSQVGVVGSVKYSVNGGRVEYNTFEVDGSDVLNTGLNGAAATLMVYPSLDAIQEVKVITANYGAQYGRTASVRCKSRPSPERRSGTETSTTLSATKRLTRAITSTLSIPSRLLPDRLRPGRHWDHAPLYRGRISEEPSVGRSTFPTLQHHKGQDVFLLLGGISAGENAYRVQRGGAGLKERGLLLTSQGCNRTCRWTRDGSLFPGFRLYRRVPGEHHRLRSLTVPRLPVAAEPGRWWVLIALPHLQAGAGFRRAAPVWIRTR